MNDNLYGFYPPTDHTNGIAKMRYDVHERVMATVLMTVGNDLVFQCTSTQVAVKIAGRDAHAIFSTTVRYDHPVVISGAQFSSIQKRRAAGWNVVNEHFDADHITQGMAEFIESLQALNDAGMLEKRR